MESKHLGQLNPQTYFCSCGMFPANESGSCDHWPRPEFTSSPRDLQILAGIVFFVLLAAITVCGLIYAGTK